MSLMEKIIAKLQEEVAEAKEDDYAESLDSQTWCHNIITDIFDESVREYMAALNPRTSAAPHPRYTAPGLVWIDEMTPMTPEMWQRLLDKGIATMHPSRRNVAMLRTGLYLHRDVSIGYETSTREPEPDEELGELAEGQPFIGAPRRRRRP